MGFTAWLAERQIRSFTRGICKTMVFGSNLHLNYAQKKGIKINSYSDLAVMTLKDRPGWKNVGENIFVHKKGPSLSIDKDYSVADMTLFVILCELEAKLGRQSITRQILNTVINEYRKYFKNYPEEKIKIVVRAWSYRPRVNGGLNFSFFIDEWLKEKLT